MTTFAAEQLDRLVDHALRLLTGGDAAGACELASRVVRDQPHHLRGRAAHAKALLALNLPADAVATLDAAHWHQQNDDHAADDAIAAHLLVLRSEALARIGKRAEAIDAAEQALRHRPHHAAALWRLANLCLSDGAADRAVRLLKRLLRRQPNRAAAWRLLARAYEAIGCADLAIGIYERLDGQTAQSRMTARRRAARLHIAHLHRQAQRWPEAAEELEALVAADPHDAALACDAARVAIELGEDVRAVRYLRSALDSRSDHWPARVMLAEQHLRAGRFAKAGYQWWKLTQRGGAREQAYAGLIVAAVSADRLRLADRLIARYEATCDLSQRRRHLSHMWQLAMPGRLLTDLRNGTLSEDRSQLLPGLLADAADVLAKHLVDHVDHADKHFHLAMCRSAMGRNDLAAAGLDRALRLNSGYIAAARHRTELLLDESNLAAAAAVVASTIAARPDAELSMLDLSLCITVMRGNVATAAEELSRIDESHRHAIGASAVRLLERYASPRACRQWLTASSATMQTDALALGEAA